MPFYVGANWFDLRFVFAFLFEMFILCYKSWLTSLFCLVIYFPVNVVKHGKLNILHNHQPALFSSVMILINQTFFLLQNVLYNECIPSIFNLQKQDASFQSNSWLIGKREATWHKLPPVTWDIKAKALNLTH